MAKIIKSGSILSNPTNLQEGSVQDSIEDRSAFLRSEEVVTWTGTELQFTKDIVLEIASAKDGSVKTYTIPLASSPLAIANGETAYIQINRTASGAATVVLSNTTAIPSQTAQNKDIFVLFKRVDTAAGLQMLHIPLHKQVLEVGQSVFPGASGSGGGGGSAAALYIDRLNLSTFGFVTPYIASEDKKTLTDVTSVAKFDPASKTFKFTNIGDLFLTKQMLGVDFLSKAVALDKLELYLKWDIDFVDPNAVYSLSEDGGANFETIIMNRIGNSDSFQGELKLQHSGADSIVNEYALINADGSVELDNAANQASSNKFTIAATTFIRNTKFKITKLGNPLGFYKFKIVKDVLGAPSLDVLDVIYESEGVSISGLAVGSNTVSMLSDLVLKAGDYHLIVETVGYQASFVTGVTSIAIERDISTAPAPNMRSFNGTIWSAEVVNNRIVHQFDGRVLDLRIKILSSIADARLKSVGVYYDNEVGVVSTNNIFRDLKQFSGTANLDTFTLNFLPDSRLLSVYSIETGQTYRFGAFTIQGHNIVFPANTFNVPSEPKITLEFVQIQGVDGQVSTTIADSLLTANNLGSVDATIDKSVAGKGIKLRDANGQLVELYVDANMTIKLRIV